MSDSRILLFACWLVERLCKAELVEEIQGNLEEFHCYLRSERKPLSSLRFFYELLHYLRPTFLQLFKPKPFMPMFLFDPKIAVRNLVKHRSTSIISLLGFVLGLTSVMFLYFYIQNELSYDSFHVDKERIFRAYRMTVNNAGEKYPVAPTSGSYAPALANDFPETIKATNRVLFDGGLVSYGDHRFYENGMIFTDPNFFTFFSFPLKYGDPASVLSGANSVVISEEIARKYFGEENPLGKVIDVDAGDYQFIVTGVLDKLPSRSHMQFDMVFSIALFESRGWLQRWGNNNLCTYIKLGSPVEADYLEGQLPDFMEKYMGEQLASLGSPVWGLKLESLEDLYFNDIQYEFREVKHGSKTTVFTLGSIAIAILFIACFNYINLSIAQSYKRAKEVGVRKVLGVNRKGLIAQFMSESFILLFLSTVISIFCSELLRVNFNRLLDLEVTYHWNDPLIITFFAGLFFVVVITAGLYPALLLSSFRPLTVLKTGKPSMGKNIFP